MAKGFSPPPLNSVSDQATRSALQAIYNHIRTLTTGSGRSAPTMIGSAMDPSAQTAPNRKSNAPTLESVAAKVEAAAKLFDTAALRDLNTRIKLVDVNVGGHLGGLVNLTQLQQSLLYKLDQDITNAGSSILDTLVHVQNIDQKLTDAGIVVNPSTGQVYIYGLEEYKTTNNARMSSAEIRLDGAEANINLKASVAYVDSAIATAVIDPSQIAELGDIYARLSSAEVDIDGVQASVLLKASIIELDGVKDRVTTAEGTLVTQAGQIAAKASTSTVDAIDARLDTAETTLSTIDGAQITSQVASIRGIHKALDASAEASLADILFTNKGLQTQVSALALARQDLSAYTDEKFNAEAQARLQLNAQINDPTTGLPATRSLLVNDYYTKTGTDVAISTSKSFLIARMDSGTSMTIRSATKPTKRGVDANGADILLQAGDLWIDTGNDPIITYVYTAQAAPNDWALTDTRAASVESRVTNIEEAKIGYATLNATGETFDNGGLILTKDDVTAWNVANPSNQATWHVGLPIAQAVKQVNVSDGASSLTLEQRFTAQKTVNGDFYGQYGLKIDNNGYVSGFNLTSENVAGETPVSTFIVSVDKFAVATPDSSVSLWAATTSYAVGKCVRVADNATKMLICKVAGTSGGSTPSLAGILGSKVTDGTVVWQVASRIPFSVVTNTTTINGVAVDPGVYIDGATVMNGTIGSNQVAELDAGKILTGYLSADRIDALSITAGKIDTRGLTIKDNEGNVIFSSGVALDWTHISSSYPSGIDNSNVTATGLGAVKTDLSNAPAGILNSNITAAGLGAFLASSAGALATKNTIDSTTYIDSALILDAYIHDLTVSKLSSGVMEGTAGEFALDSDAVTFAGQQAVGAIAASASGTSAFLSTQIHASATGTAGAAALFGNIASNSNAPAVVVANNTTSSFSSSNHRSLVSIGSSGYGVNVQYRGSTGGATSVTEVQIADGDYALSIVKGDLNIVQTPSSGSATANFSSTTKPGSTSTNAWLRIKCDGVSYYIPVWS